MTNPKAEVARLTAELAYAWEALDRLQQTWAENKPAVAYKQRAEAAEAERDALKAQLAQKGAATPAYEGYSPDCRCKPLPEPPYEDCPVHGEATPAASVDGPTTLHRELAKRGISAEKDRLR